MSWTLKQPCRNTTPTYLFLKGVRDGTWFVRRPLDPFPTFTVTTGTSISLARYGEVVGITCFKNSASPKVPATPYETELPISLVDCPPRSSHPPRLRLPTPYCTRPLTVPGCPRPPYPVQCVRLWAYHRSTIPGQQRLTRRVDPPTRQDSPKGSIGGILSLSLSGRGNC